MEHFILDPKIRMELPDVIARQISMVFKVMFGVHVERSDRAQTTFSDDDLIAKVALSQGQIKIMLRFGFPRLMLGTLLQKIYSPAVAKHETTFEDAVCEIANIVCNAVKKHLNENGFSLLMSIPKIDHDAHSRYEKGSDDHLELDFRYNGEAFSVDMITFYKNNILNNEAYS